jgi:hypothetical protein
MTKGLNYQRSALNAVAHGRAAALVRRSQIEEPKMSNGPPSRDRRSLQELAKLASSPNLAPNSTRTPPPSSVRPGPPSSAKTPPPSSVAPAKSPNDSGIVDLNVIAKTDEGATERAKTTPLASAGLFDDDQENPSVAPPPMSSPPASAKVPSTRAPESRTAESKPRSSMQAVVAGSAPKPSGNGVIVPIIAGLGLAALAAVGFMMTRTPNTAKNPPAVAATEGPTAPAPSAATAPTPPVAAAPPPAAAPPAATTDTPPAADPGAPATSPGAATAGHGGLSKTASAKKGAAAAEAPGGSTISPLTAMMAQATNSPTTAPLAGDPVAPATPGALNDAMKHAVGAGAEPAVATTSAAPAAPQFAPGTVPVTSALNRALPSARNCLNPDDPVSKANVTFSSAGTVSSVVVTGNAAGKPAEECIRGAMMKAQVAPFAQATYSANVTVRPN